MSQNDAYVIPADICRIKTEVAKSRFIATVAPAQTVEDAKSFIKQIRAEMPDASHHVYAFRVGFGNSVTEGMSDDGEPAGTAGPPILAILRGSEIGDIAIVVTRYFGGTKLGTGGLVRAYSEATHIALNTLNIKEKVKTIAVRLEVPYPLFERVKRLIETYSGELDNEEFMVEVSLLVKFREHQLADFVKELTDLSAGKITPMYID